MSKELSPHVKNKMNKRKNRKRVVNKPKLTPEEIEQKEFAAKMEKNPIEVEETPESVSEVKRGRGRPKGSKNKKTLIKEAVEAPKRRGRPKGSKNKKTLEKIAAQASVAPQKKRGRGRPPGAKNKKTLEREAMLAANPPAPVVKEDKVATSFQIPESMDMAVKQLQEKFPQESGKPGKKSVIYRMALEVLDGLVKTFGADMEAINNAVKMINEGNVTLKESAYNSDTEVNNGLW